MSTYSAVRLSKHFTLLDFLVGHTLYSAGHPLPLKDIPPTAIRTGQKLCEELLEPIVDQLGPISISNGFVPRALLSGRWTPHTWQPQDGAAADIIVHNWERAPIHLVEWLRSKGLSFERFISYGGSPVVCLSGGRMPANRGAIYENRLVHGSTKPEFITWSRGGSARPICIPERENWKWEGKETPYHTQGMFRPQHLRVGRYFTALDFCRNETAIEAGKPWVPRFSSTRLLQACHNVADVLDGVVRQVGRISITRGITKPGDGVLSNHTWEDDEISCEFQLPLGAAQTTLDHPAVLDAKWRDAPGGSPRCTVTVKRFEPRQWFSQPLQSFKKA